jgi:hypothetical protein
MTEYAKLTLSAPGHALSTRADHRIPIARVGGRESHAWWYSSNNSLAWCLGHHGGGSQRT